VALQSVLKELFGYVLSSNRLWWLSD